MDTENPIIQMVIDEPWYEFSREHVEDDFGRDLRQKQYDSAQPLWKSVHEACSESFER